MAKLLIMTHMFSPLFIVISAKNPGNMQKNHDMLEELIDCVIQLVQNDIRIFVRLNMIILSHKNSILSEANLSEKYINKICNVIVVKTKKYIYILETYPLLLRLFDCTIIRFVDNLMLNWWYWINYLRKRNITITPVIILTKRCLWIRQNFYIWQN